MYHLQRLHFNIPLIWPGVTQETRIFILLPRNPLYTMAIPVYTSKIRPPGFYTRSRGLRAFAAAFFAKRKRRETAVLRGLGPSAKSPACSRDFGFAKSRRKSSRPL
jgi:hypothetical protein